MIEARGRTFTPPRRTTLSPHAQAQRSMVYSPKRILHPLKRVDFDPDGERNTAEPRRLRLRAHQLGRGPRPGRRPSSSARSARYGPAPILTTRSSHHLWGNVGYRHSAYYRFINLMGMVPTASTTPTAGRAGTGAPCHMWGFSHRLGIPEQYDLLEDALKHTEMVVFWSADPESTGGGIYSAFESTSRRFWMKELGIKMVFIDPYYNHTAGLFSATSGSRRAWAPTWPSASASRYTWLTEGTYDKEYVAERTTGFDEWKDYVLGKTDGVPKTPEWAETESRHPRPRDPRPGARVGHQEDHARRRRPGRLGRRLPLRHRQRVGAHHGRARRHAGLRQAGQQHLGHLPGRAVGPLLRVPRLRRGRHLRRPRQVGGRLPLALPHVPERRRHHRTPHHSTEGQTVPRLRIPEAMMHEKFEWRGKGFCGPSIESQFQKYQYPAPGYPHVTMY